MPVRPPSLPIPYRFITIDLDGTLVSGTVYEHVAAGLGKRAVIQALDRDLDAGRIALPDWNERGFELFRGMEVQKAHETLAAAPWIRNIPEAVHELKHLGLEVGVLTDNPRFMVEVLSLKGFDHLVCADSKVADGLVVARQGKDDKLANLKDYCRDRHWTLHETIHVGNGTNDVPVFRAAGHSIAVNPEKPVVSESARDVIPRLTDLRQVVEAVRRHLDRAAPA
ncbi:MAG: HAD family hydrolase [Methanobacteriota archaeon]